MKGEGSIQTGCFSNHPWNLCTVQKSYTNSLFVCVRCFYTHYGSLSWVWSFLMTSFFLIYKLVGRVVIKSLYTNRACGSVRNLGVVQRQTAEFSLLSAVSSWNPNSHFSCSSAIASRPLRTFSYFLWINDSKSFVHVSLTINLQTQGQNVFRYFSFFAQA